MQTITKDVFTAKVRQLINFYEGSDRALYGYAEKHDCVYEAYDFMCKCNRTVGEVIEFIYDFTGRCVPELVIVDKLPDKECASA